MGRRKIRELPQSVIHRIAAGEVISHASAAVKEILENSLDAQATCIELHVLRDGGFLLRDNGCGICYADLPILCRRHTTSKLTSVEDLNEMETLGFRGEALSSISAVAKVTVTTRLDSSPHGMRAVYKDGEIVEEPMPCPALTGTTIHVDRLLLEDPFRRERSGRTLVDDLAHGLDIVRGYAVLYSGIGFTVKREGRRGMEIVVKSDDSPLERFANLFGCETAENLIPFNPEPQKSEKITFNVSGWISGSNYKSTKSRFMFFVNHRVVHCAPLKRALYAVYTSVLPKRVCFIFLHLQLPLSDVDVNIHPTKREVAWLHQEIMTQSIACHIGDLLRDSSHSHVMKAGPVMDSYLEPTEDKRCTFVRNNSLASSHPGARRLLSEGKVVGMTEEGPHVFMFHGNGLYMLEIEPLRQEFFEQLIESRLGRLELAVLDAPVKVQIDKDSDSRVQFKCAKLKELLSMAISEDGYLYSIPIPLEQYPPNYDRLGIFVARVPDLLLEWNGNEKTLNPFITETANLFAIPSTTDKAVAKHSSIHILKEILLPAMQDRYHPSKKTLVDRKILKVTVIKQLCKQCGR